ncbi:MAG: MASE1 domain-containing protein, partial [Polyangiaceae bacterium]
MRETSVSREVEIVSAKATAWTAVLVTAACYGGATVDTWLTFPGLGTAILFPSYAILTAALLFSPPRRWWIYFLASTVGNFLPHRIAGAAISFALLTEIPNYIRAAVAAYGILRFGDKARRFDSPRGMSVVLLMAVFLAPLVAAFLGAGVVTLHEPTVDYWTSWRAWLLSNTLTGFTLLPLILIGVANARSRPRLASARSAEALALTGSLLAVGTFVLFGPNSPSRLPAPLYAPVPFLLWAAVRFGPHGTGASLLLVALLAVGGTLEGKGPFVSTSPDHDLIHLQLFLLVISVPLLLLSAFVRERTKTAEELRESQHQYRTVVEDQSEMICRFRPDGKLTFVNEACCQAWRTSRQKLLETTFWSHLAPEQVDVSRYHVARATSGIPVTWEQACTLGDGAIRWEQWKVRAFFDHELSIVDYQAVGRDITERRRAEEQRRQLDTERALADALREADRRKDEFLAMLAH